MTVEQENQKIISEADAIHAKRLHDKKVQDAANDIWTVDLAVNQKLETWSLLNTQVEEARIEFEKISTAKIKFLDHRDLKKFQSEVSKK